MPKKCCVYACSTNYARSKNKSQDKVSVFRFPKDISDKEKWMQAVPNSNLIVSDNTVICELHWPKNFETLKVRGGKLRPKNPPSLWPGIPLSQIPTAPSSKV